MTLFVAIVLVFILALFLAYRSWGKLKPGKRIFALVLLVPHFLLILCFAANIHVAAAALGRRAIIGNLSAALLVSLFCHCPLWWGPLRHWAYF
jgi:hypothetical protein